MGLRTGEFTDRNINSVNRVISCLKVLNQGGQVEIGDYTYKIGETHNGGFNLLFKMDCRSSGDTESHDEWFGYSGNIITFSESCSKLSEEQITLFQANIALNKTK